MKYINFLIQLIKYAITYPIGKLFYSKAWLISERGFDAKDNGYVMFSYLRNKKKNVKVYYVISKNSNDFSKIEKLGNYVFYGSLKHYAVFAGAKVRMSTHVFSFAPGNYIGEFLKTKKHKAIDVFLQHGISHHKITFLNNENNKSDIIVCGGKPEFDYLNNYCGHKLGVSCYTGFPRFDNLHQNNVTKKQILVIPTWRQYLTKCSTKDFKESEYFNRWNDFLNDKCLIRILDENNIDLIFYPHLELQKFINCFKISSKKIRMFDITNSNVQDLLINSALLITDYSSVFFDFSYQYKPIIYFQFDREDFYSKHYEKAYFDHRIDGFGKVCFSKNELVQEINSIISNHFEVKENYKKLIEKFFQISDSNNCERLFNAICSKL